MDKKKKLKNNKKRYRKYNNIPFFKYYFSKIKNVFNYIFNVIKYYLTPRAPFNALGTHIITGYPGSGKTLLMNKIINSVDSNKYYFITNLKEFNQNNVYQINMNEVFNDNKQCFRIPTKKGHKRLYGVIFDEINLNFNKRINMTNEYKNRFIGLIEFIITHRHQGIPRIYFIGQKLELQDTQLYSLFKYQHDIIKTKKRFRYWKYYEEYAIKIPVKLKVLTRVKDISDNFIDLCKNKIKIRWNDLKTYDTWALRKDYKKLSVAELKR